MNITATRLAGVVIIEPPVFADERGFFLETYREDRYAELIGPGLRFVQDNHSHSRRGVLRGLHCQTARPQGKLVRAVRGEVFDVAVDIDPASPTFGQWVGVTLSGANQKQIYIPPGYAHGFQVLSETADVTYKCTDYYDPEGESGLIWNDPEVGIEWPLEEALISEKDLRLPSLKDISARAMSA
ncbi:MAG: dTDP-4-dehydrorhamnose 3,5-epimerase [Xanthomonadales bacterium]|nr:dTDP-4-dehydrorhamnose 3,5-epimerase [Xanthomonadales bacterium]NIN58986.1 dTDP-4-dehydrorhamnose 3,5-epimerase [Xanthomonadales bacterium]NIN74546.1 dTDP-4-dehydrorhamnose 3,5-epimerase [Xanthomonadales bacterium]NIO13295.1 dTDP-4-dehydrorhamnose 3,5-epimerase [Xanthomonadales bacterium]NIP11379.1 dTDP-4-dehydrorhamnose 3,5-epimerase [Xanthomonadales bacterium]